MASPVAVAVKRAKAEARLRVVSDAASKAFGVEFKRSTLPRNRYPDLAAMHLIENVADFLEEITKKKQTGVRT